MSETTYFDSAGNKLGLGKELGRGGEGAVFETTESPEQLVAKIYHKPLSKEKQDKILTMVDNRSDDLVKVAAWPVAAIHSGKAKGPICGFMMPKAVGFEPIHHLYSPGSRKQLFPDANWAFLIHAARNIAMSIATIHSHGHVVGDINQGNLLISKGAISKLIDCDSFQIQSTETKFLCGVGVGHFIPPELQDLDLTNLVRTPNHDNFGLAVVVFHLIMMGRHPYSGIYPTTSDVTLEEAIKAHWFAYGEKAAKRGITRPPDSLSLKLLPDTIAEMFLKAFSKEGAADDGRPTAKDWVNELGKLEHSLNICDKVPIHRYYNGLQKCPWCEAEMARKLIYFVDKSLPTLSTTFDFKKVRKQVAEIRSPGPAPEVPLPEKIVPKALPPRLVKAKQFSIIRKILAVLAIGATFYFLGAWYLLFVAPLAIWFAYVPIDKTKELSVRTLAYENVNRGYLDVASDWKVNAGESRFIKQQTELSTLLFDYRDLPNWMDKEREAMVMGVKDRQLQRYLATYLIADYDIPNIGSSQKMVLTSFSIENASDIEWSKVFNVKGFTTVMSDSLLAWKKDLEDKFVYDESKGVEKEDEVAFMKNYYTRRKQLETAILENVEALIKVKQEILDLRESMLENVTNAARERAQAKADMELIENY